MFGKGKDVLITGGAGFIGSQVVDKLIELRANITIADNLSAGSLNNVFEVWARHRLKFETHLRNNEIVAVGHRFVRVYVEEKSGVKRVVKNKDIIIHLAAEIGGRGTKKNYQLVLSKFRIFKVKRG